MVAKKSKSNNSLMIGGIVVVLVLIGAYMVSASNKASDTDKMKDDGDKMMKSGSQRADVEDDDDEEEDERANVVEVKVQGGNYYFKPDRITVKKGDRVEIELESVEGTHNLIIDEFNVASDDVKKGEDDDVEFTASKTGTYQFYCGIGNHRAQGMIGTLIVE